MRKKYPGIYAFKNIINGKMYIGKSVNVKNRQYEHLKDLKRNNHFNEHFQRAFNKYGEKVFIFGVIEFCTIEELDKKERYWVDYYDVCKSGYNIAVPNGINQGKIFTKYEIEKLSKAAKKYQATLPKSKRKAHMDYIRSFVDYTKISNNYKRKHTLYNPKTLEVVKEFETPKDCAEFLNTSTTNLCKKLNRIWNEKGQSYKGYYIIRENESFEEYLKLINKRKEILRLRSENKKDKYYDTIPYEERCKILRKNALKGSEAQKQKLRDKGESKVQVYKDGKFIKEYSIPSDAAEELNINTNGIYKVLSGENKTYKGYVFKRET